MNAELQTMIDDATASLDGRCSTVISDAMKSAYELGLSVGAGGDTRIIPPGGFAAQEKYQSAQQPPEIGPGTERVGCAVEVYPEAEPVLDRYDEQFAGGTR